MEYSLFLAQIIGIWAIIGAAAAMFGRKHFRKAAAQIHRDYALLFTISAIELLLGLVIVLKHQVWEGWPVLITLIGWAMVLEGILYLFAPEVFKRVRKMVKNDNLYNLFVIVSLALGIFLVYQGFWA